MSDLQAFRQQTREWLDQNCPPAMRTPITDSEDICWGGRNWNFKSEEQKQWLERMAAKGWTAPDWPVEYGGGGLNKAETKILREEMARINARSPLDSFGIWMIGPALLKFGSEELKQQHLPPIVRGEIRWCQGYSEPGSGSDLAGLQAKGKTAATTLLPMARKSGPPMQISATGCSACCAPTLKQKNRWVSALCSSI